MEFLSTQRLYTLNDLKKFINTEDYAIIGEMHHFLRDQLEKLKHNTSYKYLDKALRPKIVDLKMLLTELMSNYETTIFKSSREYSIPDVPNYNNYDRTADQYNEENHFLQEDIQINNLKFPRPKELIPNKFPIEELDDVDILKRMCMSVDKEVSLYPEFDKNLEEEVSTRATTKYKERLERKQKKSKEEYLNDGVNKQTVDMNFLEISKDSSLLMIPVIINNICYSFLADPGAEKSVINIQIIPKDIQLNEANVSLSTCTSKSADIVEGSTVLPSIFIDDENTKYTMNIKYLVLNSTNGFAGILGNDIFRSRNSICMNFEDKQWEVRIDKKIKQFPLFSFEKSVLINLISPNDVTLQHGEKRDVLCKLNIHEDSFFDKLNKNVSDLHKHCKNNEVRLDNISTNIEFPSNRCFEIGYFQNDKFSIYDIKGFTINAKDDFRVIEIENISGADIKFEKDQPLFPAHQCFIKKDDIKLMNTSLNSEKPIGHDTPIDRELTKEMVYSDLRKYFPTKPDIQVFKEYAEEMSQIPTPKINTNIPVEDDAITDFKHTNLEVLDDDFLDKTDKQTVLIDSRTKDDKYSIDDINLDHVENQLREANKRLIKKYKNIFAKDPYDVGDTDLLEANIDVSEIPKRQQQRVIHPDKIKMTQGIIDKFLENGVISVCPNPLYTSNLVLVAKYKSSNRYTTNADGLHKIEDEIISYRLCQDFRALNAATKVKFNTAYSNPLRDLSKFAGKVMTSLDICQAYFSVRLDEYTKRLTAFYFDKKIYCWNKLSQGLQNAPMLFIYFLTLVFSDESLSDALKELTTTEMELLERSHSKISWSEFLESYFDDIWIFSEDHELHYVHLKLTFHALYKAKLKINPKKVKMYTYECSILGQKFNSKNIELFMDGVKLSHILSWGRPNSCFELHSRLCSLFYLVRFLPLLKHFALPLIEILRSKNFKWGKVENIAWSNIMLLVKLDIHLTVPTPEQKLVLFSDASKFACSQILFVEKDGYLKLVACNSAVFGKQDVRKAPYIKECISLIKGLKTFEPYIAASTQKTVVFCDALSIVYVNRSKTFEINSFNLVNHLLYFQTNYRFQLLHLPGKYNVLSDICSRSFRNSRYFKDELVLSKQKAKILPPLPDKAFFESDVLYQYLTEECPPELNDHFDKKIKAPSVPRPLKYLSELYKDKTPEEKCYFASKLLENDDIDPSYRTLERLDHTQTLKKRVCKLNLLKFDKNQYKIDEIFNQNFHIDYQKPNTLAEINAILNVDPSVIFTSEQLFDGEIVNRYNYLIQPNHTTTISTGLKMKIGAPIFIISKLKDFNLYSKIGKDNELTLTFTNLSKSTVELRPGDILAMLFSNTNPNIYTIEENLFEKIELPVHYLPNIPFPFIGKQVLLDSNKNNVASVNSKSTSDQEFCKNQALKHVTFKLPESAYVNNIRTNTTLSDKVVELNNQDRKILISDNIIQANGKLPKYLFIELQDTDEYCQKMADNPSFKTKDQVLYKKSEIFDKMVIPEILVEPLIKETHLRYCHPGQDTLARIINQYYHIRNLKERLEKFYRNCIICCKLRVKNKTQHDIGKEREFKASYPRETIFIDLIPLESLYDQSHNYRGFILILDSYSKLLSAIPLTQLNSDCVALGLITYFLNQGPPLKIFSDNDITIISAVERLQEYYEIDFKTAPGYTHHRNIVEAGYSVLKPLIINALYEPSHELTRSNWPQALVYALQSYNKMPFRRAPELTREIVHYRRCNPNMPYIYTDDYQLSDEVIDASLFKKRMSEIKYYDKNKPFSNYHEGQVVYATPAATHIGQSSSYLCPTSGPYKITEVNDVSRELKALKMGTKNLHTISYDNVRSQPLGQSIDILLTKDWDFPVINKKARPVSVEISNVYDNEPSDEVTTTNEEKVTEITQQEASIEPRQEDDVVNPNLSEVDEAPTKDKMNEVVRKSTRVKRRPSRLDL